MDLFFRRRAAAAVLVTILSTLSALAQRSVTSEMTADAAAYIDPASGTSSIDLVRRALRSNREIAASQLTLSRARARVAQARLLPNPSLDFESIGGSGGSTDRDTAIGFAVPLEMGGKRSSRIGVAQAELRVAEAEFDDRRRRVVQEVMAAYTEAIAALRELDVTARLNELDVETGNYVQTRVKEGDAPPLELSLLRVEIERLRARRILLRGEVDAAIHRLRAVTGIPAGERLAFRQSFSAAATSEQPRSSSEAVLIALRQRPDLKAARLNESVAAANLRLARAQAFPDITLFTKYERERSNVETSPIGFSGDPDRHLGFGVSLSLPFFNRYQGLRAEQQAAVEQAKRQREFLETTIRAEVEAAYRRVEASDQAVRVYQSGVIDASMTNLGVVQAAYRLGEFRITDLIAERRRLTDSEREFTDLLAQRQRALTDLQIAMATFVTEEK